MPAITPKWLAGFQTNLVHLAQEDYLAAGAELQYTEVATVLPVTTGHTVLTWLLDTAQIERTGKFAGKFNYRDLVSQKLEFDVGAAQDAFKLHRFQIEDTEQGPVSMSLAAERASSWGAWMAYWPQVETTQGLVLGNTDAYPCYDGLPLFHGSHPINPARSGSPTFSNLWTTGSGPGLLPIHTSGTGAVSQEQAIRNLAKGAAYIRSIKSSNGVTPRRLRLKKIVTGPELHAAAVAATQSKIVASTSGTGNAQGGTADVEAFIRSTGLADPIQFDELTDAKFATDYILIAEVIGKRRLGPFVYAEREAFRMTQYTPLDTNQLGNIQEFQWNLLGRNSLIAGHPYLAFYCKGVA